MTLKITPIKAKVKRFLEIQKYNKEQKFLNKYVSIDSDMPRDTFLKLDEARKGIADYAKSKGVTVRIADADRDFAKEKFEFDVDERLAKRAANGNLSITVKPLKFKRSDRVVSATNYASKEVDKTYLHNVSSYYVENISSDGLQQVRPTILTYEDTFLRNIYRQIEALVKNFEKNNMKK